MSPSITGGIPASLLGHQIENWILEKAKIRTEFDPAEAVSLLKSFGLVSEENDNLHVLPLATALRHLPQQPESIVLRQEADVSDIEGYDRDSYLESEKHLKREDAKSRKYGWF